MIKYVPILVFAVVIFNNSNGIVGNAKIEHDSSMKIKAGEYKGGIRGKASLVVFNFTPRRKRDIVSRGRKKSEQLEHLIVPDREWLQVWVKKSGRERGNDAKYAPDIDAGSGDTESMDDAKLEARRNGRMKFKKPETPPIFPLNSVPRKKRSVILKKRITTERRMKLLKIPGRERRFRLKKRGKCGKNVKGDVPADSEDSIGSSSKGTNDKRCSICDDSFRFDRDYVKHCLETHGNSKPYACSYCESEFKYKRNFIQHVDEKHETESKQPAWKTEKEIRCDACGEMQRNWFAYEHHALVKHDDVPLMKCSYCPKSYFRRSTAITHMRLKHAAEKREMRDGMEVKKASDTNVADANIIRFKSRNTVFTCEYCNLDIAGRYHYERHGKKHHRGLPMHRCQECKQGFSYLKTLRNHEREKHGDDKISCAYCTRCYYNLRHLQQHEYTCGKRAEKEAFFKKRGLPSYRCHFCQRELCLPLNSFKKHLQQHKNYVHCPICNQGFNKSRDPEILAEHIRVRHPLWQNINALLKTANEIKVKRENISN